MRSFCRLFLSTIINYKKITLQKKVKKIEKVEKKRRVEKKMKKNVKYLLQKKYFPSLCRPVLSFCELPRLVTPLVSQ
jgi:hypothetical protein